MHCFPQCQIYKFLFFMQTAVSCIFNNLLQKNKRQIPVNILLNFKFNSFPAFFSLCKVTQINGYNFVTIVTVLFLLNFYAFYS